jgi:1-aminocyclopropane-1-carboxylate deaminase
MAQHGVAIEPVYSGKALRSLFWYLQQHPSSSERRITFFHTGGMQGLKGLHYRNMINDEQFRILSSS